MTDIERLNEAEAAYHRLMIGTSFVEVRDANGEMIRYKPADATKLLAYISTLKRLVGLAATSRPMGVIG